MSRRLTTPHTPAPRTHLLSNGQLPRDADQRRVGLQHLPRPGRDPLARGRHPRLLGPVLSTSATSPAGSSGRPATSRSAGPPTTTRSIFSADKAAFRRRDGAIETLLEVTVSPEQPGRGPPRHADQPRHPPARAGADQLRRGRPGPPRAPTWRTRPSASCSSRPSGCPARRPCSAAAGRARPSRSRSGPSTSRRRTVRPRATPQFETDRARFLGRGRTPAEPRRAGPRGGALGHDRAGARPDLQPPPPGPPRAGRLGRRRVHHGRRRHPRRGPGAGRPVPRDRRRRPRLRAGLGAQPGRAPAPALVARGGPPVPAAGLAHPLRRLGAARRPGGPAPPTARASPALWRHGISGDRPIVLVRVAGADELPLARQLLAAHAYLRLKGLEFDLVLLDEEPASYLDELNRSLSDLIRVRDAQGLTDQPGGVFVRTAAHIPDEDKVLLQAAARVVLVGDRGPLASQLDRIERPPPLPAALATIARAAPPGTTSRIRAARRPAASPTAWAASRPTAASTA